MKQIIHIKHLFSMIFFIGLSLTGLAQTLNPSSISTNGSVNTIVQDSSAIYLGGAFSTAGYKATGIAKINSNGLSAFGFPSIQGQCYALVSDGIGGWYVGGGFTVQGLSNMIHILANNTIDVSFAPNPNSTVNALYLDGNTLYVGGSFSQISSQTQSFLAAIDATTGVLQNWNPNPDGGVNSISKDANIVYVGGSFYNIGGRLSRFFAAIDATTALANPVISASSTVSSIEQDTANLYLAGSFSGENGYYTGATSLLTTASDLPDFTFPIIDGTITKSLSDGNGGWYVIGYFTVQGVSNMIHILPNNTVDVSFAPNPNSTVNALYLDGNTLYVGGSFSQISSQTQSFIAAIDATTGVLQNWNPNSDGAVYSISKDANIVYIGGSFQNIGGRQSRNLAAIDATTALANPFISASSTVTSIEQDTANLYLAGNFYGENGFYTGATSLLTAASDLSDFTFPIIDGSITKSISDGNGGWYVIGNFTFQGLSNMIHILPNNTVDVSFAPNPNSTVNALYLDGNTLYVGGSFSQISSQTQSFLAAIDATTGVLQNWNPNPDGAVNSISKDANIVYVGGSFQNIGGRQSRNLAAIDATTALANLFISASSTVTSIEQDTANLYLAGSFSGENGFYTGATSLLTTASDLPDFTFPIIDGSITKSISDGTGGWYVIGNFTVQGLSNMIHILPNNTIDVSFAPNPNSTVNALYLDGNTLYVGGSFSQISSQTQSFLAAIDATTGVLQNWNPNSDGEINTITKSGTDLFIGGNYTNIGGQNRNYISAINSSTALATAWNPNADNTVTVLEINGTDIIACGWFSNIGGQNRNYLAALSLSTGNATAWYPNPNSAVDALELNGTNAYAAGSFTTIGGQPRNYIAEISLATGNATTWNPNANSTVNAVKLIGSTVYAGGSFTTIGGQSRNYLAALNNTNGNATNWNPIPNGAIATISINGTSVFTGGSYQYLKTTSRNYLMAIAKSNGLITAWNPNPDNTVAALELNGTNAYLGGTFINIGGQPRNYIAEISLATGNATTWNPNANSTVNAVKLIGTTIYAGGSFTTIGGQSRNYLAALNNTNGDATNWNPKPNGTIATISVNGTSVFTGGSYQYLKTTSRNYLMAIAKSNGLITAWNPNPDSPVAALELNGTNAYAAGSFTTIGGQPRNYIAEISLATGNATTWNPNANSTVNAVKLIGTTIYAGGSFTTIGGQSRNYLAALNNTNGNATNWNPIPNEAIATMSVNGTSVFTGGSYHYLKTASRNYLMAIAKSNGLITAWNPNPNYLVDALELNGTNAYVGGSFTSIGGQSRNYIAEISLSTGNATTWNPNANNPVNTITLIGTTIYAGGGFTTIGGQSRNYLAALNNTDGNATTWNPKPDGGVYKIRHANTDIVAIGTFTFMNSEQRSNLMAISKSTGLIKAWSPNPNSTVETIELNGTNAYIGGAFTSVGGQTRNYIAEVNLSTGNATTWNPDANSTVNAIKRFGTTIYTGGSFTNIGGQSRNYIAALNNSTGNATTWDPNANSSVSKLSVSDSVLYVAGYYTTINSQTRNHLSSFKLQDGNITIWNPDVSGSVYDMQITGASIYISGSFNQVASQSRNNIASFSKVTGNLKSWNPNISGPVSSIIPKGKLVFCGGSFNAAGGQSCNGFAAINSNTGIPELFFPSVNGQINTLLTYDSLIYLGGSFSSIDSIDYGGLASISYPNAFFKSSLDFIIPNSGGNGGDATISVLGNGFEDGTTIKLTKSGQSDIIVPDSLFSISDGIRINATIDLHNPVAEGAWNVVVTIPDDTTMILPNSFTVEPFEEPVIETNVIGFQNVRLNTWQNYTVSVTNTGNIDARALPIYIAIDSTVQVDFFNDFVIADTLGNIIIADTLITYVPIDTLYGEPYSARVYALMLANLPGNTSDIISFKIKTSIATPFRILAWNDNPIMGSPFKGPWIECIDDVISTGIGFIPGAGCLWGMGRAVINPVIQVAVQNGGDVGAYQGNFGAKGGWGIVSDYAYGLGTGAVGCIPFGVGWLVGKAGSKIIQTVVSSSTGAKDIISSCAPVRNPPNNPGTVVTPVASMDPNDKQGPIGIGNMHFIAGGINLPYVIRFENVDSATASAQTVEVIDTIDLNVFDPATLYLGGMQVGDRAISIPFGLKSITTDVNLAPANNLILRVEANFNETTGVLRWLFSSIDPQTLQPTNNPIAGFLPPNVNSPEGSGSVMFTIRTRAIIPNGTVLKNKAYIYFDNNPPIITNEWTNTTDIVKPVSQINALAPVQYNDSTIALTLTGSDIGSGMRSYRIYYSTNSGPFNVLTSNFTGSTLEFIGKMDSTYAFFSIATDSVGNIENMKSTAEATTLLLVGTKDNFKIENMRVSVYPNPNQGNFNLAINNSRSGIFLVSIMDVFGRVIYSQNQSLNNGNNILPLSIEKTGIYFLTIGNERERIVRRVVINK